MEIQYPRIGEPWRNDFHARRYGFLMSDTLINLNHQHKYFELGYVLQGTIEHTFMDTELQLEPGDMFFIDIGKFHSYRGSPDHRILNFLFFPEALDPTYKQMTSLSQIAGSPTFRFNSDRIPLLNRPVFHDEDGSFLQHLEQIQQEILQKKPGHHQMEQTMIQQLIIRLMRLDYNAQNSTVYDQPLVQKILELLDRGYAGTISLQQISKKLGYSPSYISRMFRKHFETTFTEYLQRLRLSKSCRLLLETNWPIEKVAAEVGYDNVQFYHRLFKKFFHMTPLQYRKKRHL
ncbi:MAG: helix-turn-helix domain-containing protein [Clostridia bacterium]|nr:helix-turn-helix domain-containing protein [Clostridia bacterium]